MTKLFVFFAGALACTAPAFAGGHDGGLDGAAVVITNTFQGAQTEGIEVDVSAFGLSNNRFATVGDSTEFPEFITLYTVDISADSIAFTWGDSEFARSLAGPTPDGNHDRNYFIFDLPEDVAITAVEFDADASDLIEGSAVPVATIIGPNRIMIDFAGGVIRGAGFNPVYSVSVGPAE